MLVPAMSLPEIRAEIEKDYPILFRKACYVCEKLAKEHKLRNDELLEQVFDYYSKYKNTWLYRINISKRTRNTRFLVYYYGKKGLNAIQPAFEASTRKSGAMIFFTAHFFNRYNERRSLQLIKPYDIMKKFILENGEFHFDRLETIRGGVSRTLCVMETGVAMGVYDEITKWIRLNTYVSNATLTGNQQERYDRMRAQFEEEDL